MISRGLSPPFFKLQPISILYSHSIVFIRRYLPHFFELLSVYHIDVQRHTCASCVYICLFANVYIHLSTYRFLFLFLSGEDPQSCCFGFWTTCDLSVLNSSGKCVGSSKIGVCHPFFFFCLLLSNFPLCLTATVLLDGKGQHQSTALRRVWVYMEYISEFLTVSFSEEIQQTYLGSNKFVRYIPTNQTDKCCDNDQSRECILY